MNKKILIKEVKMENLYNLSEPQKYILLTEQFYSNPVINNIGGTSLITDTVDLDILKKSINNLVQKNESFRIQFVQKNNVIKQYVSITAKIVPIVLSR